MFIFHSLLLAETYGQQILYAYPWVNMCRCVVAHKQINAYTFFKNCLCAYMYWRNAMFIGWNNITICCNIIFTAQREREKNVCIYMYIHIHIHAAHACKVAQTCTDPGADVLRTYLYQDTVYSITGRIMQQK